MKKYYAQFPSIYQKIIVIEDGFVNKKKQIFPVIILTIFNILCSKIDTYTISMLSLHKPEMKGKTWGRGTKPVSQQGILPVEEHPAWA